MRVKILEPKWDRSCDDCRKWIYTDEGEVSTDNHGKPHVRHPRMPLPCALCAKIPDDVKKERGRAVSWRDAIDLSEKNLRAYHHYQKCRAIGRFPDDELVARHAVIIKSVFDELQRHEDAQLLSLIKVIRLQ